MDLLTKAEKLDNYLRLVASSPINQKARHNCEYLPWTDSAAKELAKKASFFAPDANIVIMSPSAEAGMPHTRPNDIICLPAFFPESQLSTTIAHEKIHLDQRKNPDKWLLLAEKEGWNHIEDSVAMAEISSEWLNRCRFNPDTILYRFFAWENRHIPLPLFVREDAPNMRDTVVYWYDRKEGIVRNFAPQSLTRKYGTLSESSQEHPFELWAYMKSK